MTGDQSAVTSTVLYENPDGTMFAPAAPATPFEEFVFIRSMSGQVSISGATGGAVAVGGTLTAAPAGWPTGATFAYRWLRDGTPIPGATASTYVAVAADAGHQLTVQVTASAQSYPTASATSGAVGVSATAATTPAPAGSRPAGGGTLSLGAVVVSGTPKVGEPLTATVAGAAAGATLGYQWLRAGGPITGATAATYTLLPADAGHEVAVHVTETESGFGAASQISGSLKVMGEAFKKTARPTIDGVVGVGRTVTARPGEWSPSAHFGYQWLLNGRAVHGATHQTLTLDHAHAGTKLSVRVTGTHPGYAAHEQTSRTVEVQKAALKATRPRISGKPQIGQTLHAHVDEWLPGTEYRYRWYAGSQPVDGVTGHSLRLVPELRGKRITLEVTGRLAGQQVSARSAATRVVRRPWSWH